MLSWIRKELGAIDFGDQRLNERFLKMGEKFLDKPTFSISQGQGNWASVKAAYRFFENEKTGSNLILQEHLKNTCERVQQTPGIILAVQDTTLLDYSHFPTTEGLGEIDKNQKTWKNSKGGQGFLAHTTLALTPEGLPLGILDQKLYLRNKRENKGDHKQKPIEEKETFRWIEPILKTSQSISDPTRVVHLGDREGDIFESFFYAQETGVKFLIRAKNDRVVGHRFNRSSKEKNTCLWEFMKRQPVAFCPLVEVPETEKTQARSAHCELRFEKTSFPAPQRYSGAKSTPLSDVEVYVVWVKEINVPTGVTPLEWMLLTNISIFTVEDALEKVVWYRCRWHIENFFKVLKSGCKVEESRLDTLKKLKKLITMKSIIAFRIYWMTWLNRICPNVNCQAVLSEQEWKALYCFHNKTRKTPKQPPSISKAMLWIAMLGGFLGRKGDGNPGTTVIWRGWQELTKITQTWEIFNDCTATYG